MLEIQTATENNLWVWVFFVLIVFAMFSTAMIALAKPINTMSFNQWFTEVQAVASGLYGIKDKALQEMVTDECWDDWYDEGLLPHQAVDRYYKKIYSLP